jgi:uncharacterized protein YrrD
MKTPESLNMMEGDSLHATDGIIGKIREFYFDDSTWNVRYAVVELGSWLNSREVLIASSLLGKPDSLHSAVPVSLTKEQVESSPDSDTDMPAARQREADMRRRYEHGVFFSWGDAFIGSHNFDIPQFAESELTQNAGGKEFDPHLRSTRFVRGSAVHATDGTIGHVRDFVVDDESWVVKGLVVEFGSLFDMKKVLVPCEWVTGISDEDAIVTMKATKEMIKSAPAVENHALEHEIGAGNASMKA